MPTYVERCKHCGHQQDYIRTVSRMEETDSHCDAPMERQGAWAIAPMVSAGVWTGHKGAFMPDGKNGGRGTWVESAQDWHKYMKQNNKAPADEAAQEARIQKANKEAADDKALTKAVEQAVQKHA